MALEGKFIWKGIEIPNAYIIIQQANCSVGWNHTQVVKDKAVLNEDGTVKTPATYEEKIEKVLNGSYTAQVYKDKASKEAKPNEVVESIYGTYVPKHTTSAKNDVAQAYVALKATDACKDLADA
tara:strand:+ start:5380 stop:5751 length:372 start_codon:yes stop_codon:yes gene_type:complete